MDKFDTSEIGNPKKTLRRREEEAGLEPSKGKNAGDLPGPTMDFFKPRDKSKAPPADMLKKHYSK